MYSQIRNFLSSINNAKKLKKILGGEFVDKYEQLKTYKENRVAFSPRSNAFSNHCDLDDVDYTDKFDSDHYKIIRKVLKNQVTEDLRDDFFETFDPQILELSLEVVRSTINLPFAAYSLNVYKDVLRYYDYAQRYSTNPVCRNAFDRAQDLINKESYPNLVLPTENSIFSYIDVDSPKYSVGLIPQKKITVFFSNFSNKGVYNSLTPNIQGSKADMWLNVVCPSRSGFSIQKLNCDVKSLSLPSFIEKDREGSTLYTVGSSSNSNIIFLDHLNALISSSLKKPESLKNLSNYNLILNVGAYPDLKMLHDYKEYQNVLNNIVLNEVRLNLEKASIYIPKTKVYFTFTGLATEEHSAPLLNEIFKFNLSIIKDTASLADDQILDIVLSLNKKN